MLRSLFFSTLENQKVLYFIKLGVVRVCTVVVLWQTQCKTSQTSGKHLTKGRIKPEFRQTLKPLNMKYRKVPLEAFNLLQVKGKEGFPVISPSLISLCLFTLRLQRLNLSFLDLFGLQHGGACASPVFCRFGFGPW